MRALCICSSISSIRDLHVQTFWVAKDAERDAEIKQDLSITTMKESMLTGQSYWQEPRGDPMG